MDPRNTRRKSGDGRQALRRFDQLFFLDYPDHQAKDRIWEIDLKGYELIGPDEDVGKIQLPSAAATVPPSGADRGHSITLVQVPIYEKGGAL